MMIIFSFQSFVSFKHWTIFQVSVLVLCRFISNSIQWATATTKWDRFKKHFTTVRI